MLYINGVKANKKDVEQLNNDIKKGKSKIKSIKLTDKNNIALIVEG